MAEFVCGNKAELVVAGLDERQLSEIRNSLGENEIDLMPLSGPGNVVSVLRHEIGELVTPNDPKWKNAVAELFTEVGEARSAITKANLGGYTMTGMGPTLINPVYKIDEQTDEDMADNSSNATSKYLFIGKPMLISLGVPRGSQEAKALRSTIGMGPEKVEDLAVRIHFKKTGDAKPNPAKVARAERRDEERRRNKRNDPNRLSARSKAPFRKLPITALR